MSDYNLKDANWRKSNRSGSNGGDCVEVADNLPNVVAVRNTKDRDGGTLVFGHSEWSIFLAGVKDGAFDL